jgi:hypothetical protein
MCDQLDLLLLQSALLLKTLLQHENRGVCIPIQSFLSRKERHRERKLAADIIVSALRSIAHGKFN